jgi:DNA-binding MarR family transcriptional regulator
MVEQVRRFNRTVTGRVGALNDRFLGRDRPLGEARLLWEIGPDGCEVRLLRSRLGLDSGYLSRLLRSLEGAGLVETAASVGDRRIRVARLTAAGRVERAALDDRADELARSLLAPLTVRQRESLVASMMEVERILTAGSVEISPVDPEHQDARYCLAEYVSELNRRSERGFDPSVGATALPHEVRPPAGRFFVAYLHGEAIGCGAVKHHAGGSRGVRVRKRRTRRAHRDERRLHRGARALPLGRLGRGATLQRRAVRRPLVREAARLRRRNPRVPARPRG